MDRAPLSTRMLNALLFDPRLRRALWVGATILMIVLAACQNNTSGGGGGPGY